MTLVRKTSAEALRKLDDVLAPLAQLSVTAAEIKKGFETLVTADQSGLVKEIKKGVETLVTAEQSGMAKVIKQGVDTIISNERSKFSSSDIRTPRKLHPQL